LSEGSGPTLRLYGRRQGRKLRSAQQDLLDDLLPRITLPAEGPLDPASLFATPVTAVWLEIGFGGGEHLADQAEQHPDIGLIGCEPFINGVVSALGHIARRQLGNVRLWSDDARLVLDRLPERSVGRAFILFPDPWRKARHHKRRIVSAENLDRLSRVLVDDAELRLASDHVEYVQWMLEHVAAHPDFTGGRIEESDRPADWPRTRYEMKARDKGIIPSLMRYRRRARP
jgi:tRNA (guanine-N7-)-methyltransferase